MQHHVVDHAHTVERHHVISSHRGSCQQNLHSNLPIRQCSEKYHSINKYRKLHYIQLIFFSFHNKCDLYFKVCNVPLAQEHQCTPVHILKLTDDLAPQAEVFECHP